MILSFRIPKGDQVKIRTLPDENAADKSPSAAPTKSVIAVGAGERQIKTHGIEEDF